MMSKKSLSENREAMIDQLLDRWEEAYDNGLSISPEELCQDNPQVLDEVRHKIDVLRTMNRCLKQQGGPVDSPHGEKNLANDSFRVNSKYGDFEVLGSGGLGIVYRAIDFELNRDVAIKFLRDKNQSKYFLEQFTAEAEITGRLDHPGVVPVYAMGRSRQGEPFYSMRLIRGLSLDQKIKEYHTSKSTLREADRRLQMRDMLHEFVSVCKTIAYAHTRGILHRDIKPQNIMLGKYGETLVVDWGLAVPFERRDQFRVLDEKTLLPRKSAGQSTPDGHGTPAYMSPEQAAGTQVLKPSSDIFSLGATLFKILTGEIPFKGKSSVEVKQKILAGGFEPPHQIDRSVPKPIGSVCSKALAHRTEDRYQTALELAEDIELFLADEPVSTYKETLSRRAARWAERNRVLAQWGTLALITAFAGAVATSIVQFQAANQQRQIKTELNDSLIKARGSQKSGAIVATRLIAESIETDMRSRFSLLEQAANKLRSQFSDLPDELDQATKSQVAEAVDNVHYESDCIKLSLAWVSLDKQGNIFLLSSEEESKQMFEDAAEKLKKVLKAKGIAAGSSPQIGPVIIDAESNQAICLITCPMNLNANNAAIGMFFKISEFSTIHREAMGLSSIHQIKLAEIAGSKSASYVFCSPDGSGSSGNAADSEIAKLNSINEAVDGPTLAWLKQTVSSSRRPVVSEFAKEHFRSAVKISIKTGQLIPVACDWFLVVDFD